jgi:hypothetical protein
MKTILLASVLAIASLTATAKSNNSSKKVSFSTLQSFQLQFGEVKSVAWSEAPEHMMKATFNSDGETVTAFFNEEGDFIATTVNRSIDELPLKLRTSINNAAKDAQIVEIVELQGDTDHAFYVKVRSGAGEKILKGYSNGYLRPTSL